MKKFTNYLKLTTKSSVAFFRRKLKIISTFNGIGAFSDASRQLALDIDMHTVCEIDDAANKTYFQNFKEYQNRLVKDIIELERSIEKGLKLDLLVQTPPCQSFSIAGKRAGLKSTNGNLFLTAIHLQKKVDANVVIYENVKGLVFHDKKVGEYASLINKEYDGKKKSIGHTLHQIEQLLLQDNRYNYYWKVINSADQGFPQNRERIFIIGIKKDLDKGFSFPDNRDLKYTVEDCLEKEVDNSFFYDSKGHQLTPTNQKIRPNRIHTSHEYKTIKYESAQRVSSPIVSPCITTGNTNKFYIEGKVRFLTPTENKRIHGFREEYQFVGSKTQQNKQLGNTVSPGVYMNLITSILNSIKLDKPVNNINYNSNETSSKKVVNSSYEIHNEDCVKTMERMISSGQKIDLIVADPPYSIKNTKTGGKSELNKSFQKSMNDIKKTNLVDGFDSDRILPLLWELQDKTNIYIWCNKEQIPMYLDFFVTKKGCSFDIIKWVKTNPVPTYHNKYMSDTEYCLYFRKGGFCNPGNYEDGSTLFQSPINTKDKKEWGHPTIKPLPIIERLIRNSSREGDVIFDPFMGSGTTGVAAKNLGRDFIGVELDETFYEIASKRIGLSHLDSEQIAA